MTCRATALASVLALVAVPSPARGELASDDPIALAEAAYDRVDFEATLGHAEAALEAGGLRRSRLVRLFELIGMSAAALEHEERARDAFIRMLALNPDSQLDRNLAPRIRGPFLEARGYWAAREDRLAVEVTFSRERGGLRIDLADPLRIAQTVYVRARAEGAEEWEHRRLSAEGLLHVSVAGARDADRVAYSLMVLDEHDNELLLEGSEDEPVVVGRPERAPAPREERRSFVGSPWFWVITSVAIAAVVGGGVAAGVVLADERQTVGVTTSVSIGIR